MTRLKTPSQTTASRGAAAVKRLTTDLSQAFNHQLEVVQGYVEFARRTLQPHSDRLPGSEAQSFSQFMRAENDVSPRLHQIETMLAGLTERSGDRLAAVFDDVEELPNPPRAVRDYIKRLEAAEIAQKAKRQVAAIAAGKEGFQEEYTRSFATVVAATLSRECNPTGGYFKLALRDLNENCARLLHTRATNAEYLALSWEATQFTAKPLSVVMQVRGCRAFGPFYEYSGKFVSAG